MCYAAIATLKDKSDKNDLRSLMKTKEFLCSYRNHVLTKKTFEKSKIKGKMLTIKQ